MWKVVRDPARIAIFAACYLTILAGAAAASAVLLPGATISVPPTTAAAEPDLAGVVIHDALIPFTIRAANGALVCEGVLQDRVVQSNQTHALHFYYRIRGTRGPGVISEVVTTGFGKISLRVAHRTDGLGTVPPRVANRNASPGAVVTFRFTDPRLLCVRNEESRFILVKTPVTKYRTGGATKIVASNGAGTSVPTVMP
ncbi:MAG: hypothetical protein ACREFP_27345 [Acetobacteraceae bacterium]